MALTLLFDLDGTLVDSIGDLAGALNSLRGELDLPALAVPEVRRMVGDGARKLVQRALPEAYQDRQWMLRFLELYGARLTRETKLFPGIGELLAAFAGWPMAVVTNKPVAMAEVIVKELGLSGYFPVVLGGDSCAEKKPHPQPVQEALRRLNARPQQAVMIGDHHTDLRSGAAADCRTCFCSWGYGEDGGESPTWRANSASELQALLAGAAS